MLRWVFGRFFIVVLVGLLIMSPLLFFDTLWDGGGFGLSHYPPCSYLVLEGVCCG